MDTNRYIERNNVLFDTLLPSGRKGDDSRRKHTNLLFMLGLFTLCSHAYSTSTLLFLYLTHDLSLSLSLYYLICVCVFVCVRVENLTLSVIHRELASDTRSLRVMLRHCLKSHLCVVGTPGPGCLILTSRHH